MIYKVEMFAAKCDNCKCEVFENSDFSCYSNPEQVRDEISNADWHETDYKKPLESKHYCPDCFEFDDNDELVIIKDRFKE